MTSPEHNPTRSDKTPHTRQFNVDLGFSGHSTESSTWFPLSRGTSTSASVAGDWIITNGLRRQWRHLASVNKHLLYPVARRIRRCTVWSRWVVDVWNMELSLSDQMYNHPRLYQFSVGIWRHFSSANLSLIYYYGSVFTFICFRGLWNRNSCYEPRLKILIDIDIGRSCLSWGHVAQGPQCPQWIGNNENIHTD